MDSYRAQRGCAVCAQQTIISFKGTDKQLLKRYENTLKVFYEQQDRSELKRAA
jgi:hypothetical protein